MASGFVWRAAHLEVVAAWGEVRLGAGRPAKIEGEENLAPCTGDSFIALGPAAFRPLPSMRDCFVFALLATWQLPHRCSRDGSTWNLRSETGSFSGPPAEDGRPHLHPDLRTDRSWRPRSLCGGGGIVPQLSPTGISCPCDLAASPKASITFMALARAKGLATKRSPLQFRTSGRRCMTAVMYSPLAGKRRA